MKRFLNAAGYWLTFLLPWMVFGVGKCSNAALDALYPILGGTCIAHEEKLQAAKIKIAELREWIKHLSPFERRAYANWITYYRIEIWIRQKELAKKHRRDNFFESGKFPRPELK